MKYLNKNSNRVFAILIEKLDERGYVKLKSEGFMDLTLERIGEDINVFGNRATHYSLSHHFVQNGDLMRDPEMCFLVIDEGHRDPAQWKILPTMYQLDPLGMYRESITIERTGVSVLNMKEYNDQVAFANGWLKNIDWQFLND